MRTEIVVGPTQYIKDIIIPTDGNKQLGLLYYWWHWYPYENIVELRRQILNSWVQIYKKEQYTMFVQRDEKFPHWTAQEIAERNERIPE